MYIVRAYRQCRKPESIEANIEKARHHMREFPDEFEKLHSELKYKYGK